MRAANNETTGAARAVGSASRRADESLRHEYKPKTDYQDRCRHAARACGKPGNRANKQVSLRLRPNLEQLQSFQNIAFVVRETRHWQLACLNGIEQCTSVNPRGD